MSCGIKKLIRNSAEFLIFAGQVGEQSSEARHVGKAALHTRKRGAEMNKNKQPESGFLKGY